MITSKAEERPLTEHKAAQNAREGKRGSSVNPVECTIHLNSSTPHLTISPPAGLLQSNAEIFNFSAVYLFVPLRDIRPGSQAQSDVSPVRKRAAGSSAEPAEMESITTVRPRSPGSGRYRTIGFEALAEWTGQKIQSATAGELGGWDVPPTPELYRVLLI